MDLGNRRILQILIATAFISSVILLYASVDNGANSSEIENASHQYGFQKQEMLIEEECVEICVSKECLTYAKFLLKNMKSSAKPCENIFNFTCGSYIERFGKDERRSTNYDAEENLYRILEDILMNIKADSESVSGKMKIVYDSCINFVSREKEALSSAKSFLAEVGIPDWPHLKAGFEIDVASTLGKLKERGETLFFMFAVPSPEPSTDYFQTQNSEMSIRLDIRYFFELLRKPNKASIFHILKYFDLGSEAIENIWNDFTRVRTIILDLEKENCNSRENIFKCSEAMQKYDENCRYSRRACLEAYMDSDRWYFNNSNEECPSSNFSCYDPNHDPSSLCKIVDSYLKSTGLSNSIKTKNVKIQQGDDSFLMQIIPTLKTLPDKVLANFLALNFYKSHLDELNFYFQDTKDRYFPHKRCQGWKPRLGLRLRRICTDWIVNNMHLAMQYEYQKAFLNLQEIDKILDAFDESKSELSKALANQEWIMKELRGIFEYVVQTASLNMVYLKEYQSQPQKYEFAINEYYKPFQPTRHKFFENGVELRKTIHDIRWLSSSINPHLLSMKFMAQATSLCKNVEYHFGFYSPPYYVPGLPRLINLILLSSFMGHELGHVLDEQLKDIREAPESPHIYQSPETFQILFNKTKNWSKCLVEQFSHFKYEYINGNLNGSVLIDENVADYYHGFLVDELIAKYYKNATITEQVTLPGMNYSPVQVLYIAANAILCSKMNHWEELFHREVDDHSPWKFRSIGIMQNSRSFSEEFSCPEGSYMNPRNKCTYLQ